MYTKVQPVDVLDIKKQQHYVSRIIEGYVMVLVGVCVCVRPGSEVDNNGRLDSVI